MSTFGSARTLKVAAARVTPGSALAARAGHDEGRQVELNPKTLRVFLAAVESEAAQQSCSDVQYLQLICSPLPYISQSEHAWAGNRGYIQYIAIADRDRSSCPVPVQQSPLVRGTRATDQGCLGDILVFANRIFGRGCAAMAKNRAAAKAGGKWIRVAAVSYSAFLNPTFREHDPAV